jgi:hypothetical protein
VILDEQLQEAVPEINRVLFNLPKKSVTDVSLYTLWLLLESECQSPCVTSQNELDISCRSEKSVQSVNTRVFFNPFFTVEYMLQTSSMKSTKSVFYKLVPISRGVSAVAYWEAMIEDAIDIDATAVDAEFKKRIMWQQPNFDQRIAIIQVRLRSFKTKFITFFPIIFISLYSFSTSFFIQTLEVLKQLTNSLPKIQLPEDWRLTEDPNNLLDLSKDPELLRKMSKKEFFKFRDLDGRKIELVTTKVVHLSMVQHIHGME